MQCNAMNEWMNVTTECKVVESKQKLGLILCILCADQSYCTVICFIQMFLFWFYSRALSVIPESLEGATQYLRIFGNTKWEAPFTLCCYCCKWYLGYDWLVEFTIIYIKHQNSKLWVAVFTLHSDMMCFITTFLSTLLELYINGTFPYMFKMV